MKNSVITMNPQHAACAVVVAASCAVSWALPVWAQAAAADPVEVQELQAALSLSQEQIEELKVEASQSEKQRKVLVESLAEAVRVSEEQMAASREMQLKLQAFGVDLLSNDESNLQQRLLKAVRDLDISRQEVEKASAAINDLSEAFMKYLQATPEVSAEERAAAEKAISSAAKAIEGSEAVADEVSPDLVGAKVISIDREIGILVLNAGREKGLRVGTPIAVLRGERPIYSAMIVDVRDSICGAVLQDKMADAEEVAVGDGVRLMPHQNNF